MAKKMFLNIVVDKSGSMWQCREETIKGLNAYIAEQKTVEDVTMLVSLTLFDTEVAQVHTACPVEDVQPLTNETYEPSGMTALNDAVAMSIASLDQSLEREKKGEYGVMLVVFTDGAENSSKEFGGAEGLANLRKIIKDKTDAGDWTFVFFGTDINAWDVSRKMGISAINTLQVARANTGQMYSGLASSTRAVAKSLSVGNLSTPEVFASNLSDYDGIADADAMPVGRNIDMGGSSTDSALSSFAKGKPKSSTDTGDKS